MKTWALIATLVVLTVTLIVSKTFRQRLYDLLFPDNNLRKANGLLWIITFVSLVVVGFAAEESHRSSLLLWALACLTSGAIIGLLFGVQKIARTKQGAQSNDEGGYNNLVKISDWLTGIIVGLTLTNLHKIKPYLPKIAAFITGSSEDGPRGVGLAIILCFASLGFFFGLINTKLFLNPAFQDSDDLKEPKPRAGTDPTPPNEPPQQPTPSTAPPATGGTQKPNNPS